MRKIWLDTDPGFDDWLTMLLLSANPWLEWLGVSVAAGNAPLDVTYDNALRIKAHYGLDVPVYRGCAEPLNGRQETAQCILGEAGMRTTGASLPPVAAAAPDLHACDALIAAIRRHPGEITLLAIAPLTNVATALLRAPDIAARIKEIILMGGSPTRAITPPPPNSISMPIRKPPMSYSAAACRCACSASTCAASWQ
jgi:purine nucleosidase